MADTTKTSVKTYEKSVQVPGLPSLPTDYSTEDWKKTQADLADMMKQRDSGSPAGQKSWGDTHPVAFGLLSLIPGFQQGYSTRMRLNQNAARIMEEHRQNMLHDRMSIDEMQMRGEISPVEAARLKVQSALMREKQKQEVAIQTFRTEQALAQKEHWKAMEHKGKGGTAKDPLPGLYTRFFSLYNQSIKGALPPEMGGAPIPSFSEWAAKYIPSPLYSAMEKAGYFAGQKTSPPPPSAPPAPDFIYKDGQFIPVGGSP